MYITFSSESHLVMPNFADIALSSLSPALYSTNYMMKRYLAEPPTHTEEIVADWQETKASELQTLLVIRMSVAIFKDLAVLVFDCSTYSFQLRYPRVLMHSCHPEDWRFPTGTITEYEMVWRTVLYQEPWSVRNLRISSSSVENARAVVRVCQIRQRLTVVLACTCFQNQFLYTSVEGQVLRRRNSFPSQKFP
ncbi:uncharacterized protein BT62DRAFT_926166 [Guyanagaster necrorhizus]|uniref:Uncharacterized protein n=1 Tax=Guyanagaster necrorhizus TaxID=856835 RepID=A0A9P8AXN2_9AGAR|nr:uncharacterized protein BT62DRAFT_926166 [Guyanagaster necrorhizus MCA 3950]KAG7451969.1 hypothetical protein BT62DRAFT_926166 [Guyanagaster necrorhizus MCA 3950]